jgi:hypothetical protein
LGVIDDVAQDYRLARSVVVRMMGAVLVLAGIVVLLAGVGVALLDWPAGVLSASVLLAAAVVLGVAVALGLARRATVVRLDETGYVVRWVRGVGVAQGRWKDVEDVVATTVAGDRCVVLRRRDGATTTIPVALLDRPGDKLVQDLQRHLDRGHGYRPLA